MRFFHFCRISGEAKSFCLGGIPFRMTEEKTSAFSSFSYIYAAVFCLIAVCVTIAVCGSDSKMSNFVGVDFEVFGRVQGVFFRKYTQARGKELGLRGWCMNTKGGTVVGRLEGEKLKVDDMKHWLQKTGSPQSLIDKAEFRNEKEISEVTFPDFSIKK